MLFQQFSNIDTQSICESLQSVYRDIGNATFKLRYIGSMEIGQFGHSLLT